MQKENKNGRLLSVTALWLYGVLTGSDLFPVILTLPTFLILAFEVRRIKSPTFTAEDMLWLCFLVFFVVGPCQTISKLSFGAGRVTYSIAEFIFAEFIILLSLVAFLLGKRLGKTATSSQIIRAPTETVLLIKTRHALCLGVFVGVGFFGFVTAFGGMENVLLPRLEKNRESVSFVAYIFLAMHVTATLVLAKVISKKIPSGFANILLCITFLCALALLLIVVNPINSPRFFIVGAWLPIILSYFGRRVKYQYVYASILIGLVVLMPIMSISSRSGFDAVLDISQTEYSKDVFVIKDVDVFDTLVHAVRIMDVRDYYYGENLLAVLLFFVPRSLWMEKPIVGGLHIGNDLYSKSLAGTNNLSFFIGGDFYLDFGLIGVVAGLGLMGFFWARRQAKLATGGFYPDILNLILIGSLPILLRGPMGAVVGFFTCMIFSTLLIRAFLSERRILRKSMSQ